MMMPTFEYDKRLSCGGPKAWRDLALHEAGHAVAFVQRGCEFLYVTINPHHGPGGHLRHRNEKVLSFLGYKVIGLDVVEMSQKERVRYLEDETFSRLAGPEASYRFSGKRNGLKDDSYLAAFVVERVLKDKKAIRQHFRTQAILVHEFVNSEPWWSAIEAVADALFKSGHLRFAQVKAIVNKVNRQHARQLKDNLPSAAIASAEGLNTGVCGVIADSGSLSRCSDRGPCGL
jgi:hypothetical protein